MIPFPDALRQLLAATPLLETERIRIEAAAGRVLRQEVRTDRPMPPFDRVMMDGYALRSADWGAGSREFQLTGTAPAGQPATKLAAAAGTCVEVMTGAPLPQDADVIVPVEHTTPTPCGAIRVNLPADPVPGEFIHRAGSDARAGALVLTPGCRLGSRQIGVAVSCGAAWVEVGRQPRLSVFATGDELVAVDEIPRPHQIRQSNAHAIAAALAIAGYPVAAADTLPDNPATAATRLAAALASSDWLVLTGAISKGARDFIPNMLDRLGCRRLFHGIAQRPGKPAGCWLGPAGQVIAALPGNPVSALTGLHALVLPALAAACGQEPAPQRLLQLAVPVPPPSRATLHLPVLVRDGLAHPAPPGNSGDFLGLLRSDGFLTLVPDNGPATRFPFTPWL